MGSDYGQESGNLTSQVRGLLSLQVTLMVRGSYQEVHPLFTTARTGTEKGFRALYSQEPECCWLKWNKARREEVKR